MNAPRDDPGPLRRDGLRFRPPPAPSTPELRWVLARAFADGAALPSSVDLGRALETAGRLGLLPRLAFRAGELGESELGAEAADRLRAERSLALARELAFDEALAGVAAAAERTGIAPALLKGRALVVAGFSKPGTRPAADLDLLLPARAVRAFAAELDGAGWRPAGARGHEQHAPPLRHPAGVQLELHDRILGVRLDRPGGRSARWTELEARGLLAPPSGGPRSIRIPARSVLLAHAVVHAVAQHGLAPQYRSWLLVGDLIDLAPAAEDERAARRWTARDVAPAEWDAVLALARLAARGTDPSAEPHSPAGILARHLTACALDEGYGDSLRLRRLERPLTDRPLLVARLGSLLHALVPPPAEPADAESKRDRSAAAMRWLRRPFELVARRNRARRAERELRRSSEGSLD